MAYTLTVQYVATWACCAKERDGALFCCSARRNRSGVSVLCNRALDVKGVATHVLSICVHVQGLCLFPTPCDLFADRPQCSPLCRGFYANAAGGKTKDEDSLGQRAHRFGLLLFLTSMFWHWCNVRRALSLDKTHHVPGRLSLLTGGFLISHSNVFYEGDCFQVVVQEVIAWQLKYRTREWGVTHGKGLQVEIQLRPLLRGWHTFLQENY